MKKLKIALLQIKPCDALAGNLEKGLEACKRAAELGADIALFPEMWNCGYTISENMSKAELDAISLSDDGKFVMAFSDFARENNIAVGITILEKTDFQPKNTLILFDRYGNKALKYSKVHTCDFGDEKVLSAGDDFYVTELDTESGKVKIGAMICYDREFPESARILMLKGAEIVLVPNACPLEINRLSQLRGRAFENMLGIATCNYPEGIPDCNGHSCAFDGVAYLPNADGSRDTCILEAGGDEGVYIAEFDLDMLREYRASEALGNAYRHPQKYHMLIDETIEEPFVRADYRK